MKQYKGKINPVNVLNTIKPVEEKKLKTHIIHMPKAIPAYHRNAVKTIRRACLQIVTNRIVKSVLVFEFKETGTIWTVYEQQSLSESERKGLIIAAMKLMKHNQFESQLPVETIVNSSIKDKKPILRHLESIEEDDKVFIVILLKDVMFTFGNAYDESTLCLAYLQKQHAFGGRVISNMKHGQSSKYILAGNPVTHPKITLTPQFPPV